jgi:hypothetical protein
MSPEMCGVRGLEFRMGCVLGLQQVECAVHVVPGFKCVGMKKGHCLEACGSNFNLSTSSV